MRTLLPNEIDSLKNSIILLYDGTNKMTCKVLSPWRTHKGYRRCEVEWYYPDISSPFLSQDKLNMWITTRDAFVLSETDYKLWVL